MRVVGGRTACVVMFCNHTFKNMPLWYAGLRCRQAKLLIENRQNPTASVNFKRTSASFWFANSHGQHQKAISSAAQMSLALSTCLSAATIVCYTAKCVSWVVAPQQQQRHLSCLGCCWWLNARSRRCGRREHMGPHAYGWMDAGLQDWA